MRNLTMFKTSCSRRSGLGITLLACISPNLVASQTGWQTKPVKDIVPFSPGGVSEGVARLVSLHLADKLGQPVIVENKPGVSRILGTQLAVSSCKALCNHLGLPDGEKRIYPLNP